jgi:hypothetical protein
MQDARPIPDSTHNPFRGFDESVERVLGADMRLIYGMAVPILMVCGLIVVLALSPATWLVVAVLVIEIALLAVVVLGFFGLLNEDEPRNEMR